jgi:hypothetical protein
VDYILIQDIPASQVVRVVKPAEERPKVEGVGLGDRKLALSGPSNPAAPSTVSRSLDKSPAHELKREADPVSTVVAMVETPSEAALKTIPTTLPNEVLPIPAGWHFGLGADPGATELEQRTDLAVKEDVAVAVEADRPVFEPMDPSFAEEGLAYELNHQSEGLGVIPPLPTLDRPAKGLSTEVQTFLVSWHVGLGASLTASEPEIAVSRTLPPDVFAPVLASSKTMVATSGTLPADVFAPAPKLVEEESIVLNDELGGGLANDLDGVQAEMPEERAEDERGEPSRQNLLVRDLYLGIMPDFDGTLQAVESASVQSRIMQEVPVTLGLMIEPGADVYNNLAVALDRRGESAVSKTTATQAVTIASRPVDGRSDSEAPGLSNAVRLTRDAAFAWFKVLTGPALVTAQR